MRLAEVDKKAKQMGIRYPWIHSKKSLIKTIQRKEGNFACFGTAKGGCTQAACCWREDCLR